MKKTIIKLAVPKYTIVYLIGTYEEVIEWFDKKIKETEGDKKKNKLRNLLISKLRNFKKYEEPDKNGLRKCDGGKTGGLTIKLEIGKSDLVWINTKSAKTRRVQLLSIVHENRHISDHIENSKGICDSEFFAYLEGYLYDQLYELLTKKEGKN